MRKLIELMCKGEQDAPFTRFEKVFYGILLPLGLVALMGLAGWLENKF